MCAQSAAAAAQSAQQAAEESGEHTQAALDSLRRKLGVYKEENRALLASHDAWLRTLVQQRGLVV